MKNRISGDSVRVIGDGALKAADVDTEEYPGFPTDMQAQYMALATQAEGASLVTENIFENRFMHAQELVRMGANIKIEGRRADRERKTPLSAAAVLASTCALQRRWCSRPWSRTARPLSIAFTTLIAGTSTSKRSCAG